MYSNNFTRLFTIAFAGLVLVLNGAVVAQYHDPHLPNPVARKKAVGTSVTKNTPGPTQVTAAANPKAETKQIAAGGSLNELSPSPWPASGRGQAKPPDTGWHFAFSPYFFGAGMSGTIGTNGHSTSVDNGFGNLWDTMDWGFMGTFDARKRWFVFTNDFQWVKLGGDRVTAGGVYASTKANSKVFIFDPEAGVRVVSGKGGFLDVLGGVRVFNVTNELTATSGTRAGFSVSESRTFAAPVMGFRGNLNLSKRWYLNTKMDFGFGGDLDTTSQIYGGTGFRLTPGFALTGGYRYLQANYRDGQGFIYDNHMSGFIFGARIGGF